MLTIAAVISLGIGIGKDISSGAPTDEPKIGWYVNNNNNNIILHKIAKRGKNK